MIASGPRAACTDATLIPPGHWSRYSRLCPVAVLDRVEAEGPEEVGRKRANQRSPYSERCVKHTRASMRSNVACCGLPSHRLLRRRASPGVIFRPLAHGRTHVHVMAPWRPRAQRAYTRTYASTWNTKNTHCTTCPPACPSPRGPSDAAADPSCLRSHQHDKVVPAKRTPPRRIEQILHEPCGVTEPAHLHLPRLGGQERRGRLRVPDLIIGMVHGPAGVSARRRSSCGFGGCGRR